MAYKFHRVLFISLSLIATSFPTLKKSDAAGGVFSGGAAKPGRASTPEEREAGKREKHNGRSKLPKGLIERFKKNKYAIIGCGHFDGDYPVPEDIGNLRKKPGFYEGPHKHEDVITMNINPAYNPDIVGSILNEDDVEKMAEKGPYKVVYMEMGGMDLVSNPKTHINNYSLVEPGGSYVFDGISIYGAQYPGSAILDDIEKNGEGKLIYTGWMPLGEEQKRLMTEPFIVYKDREGYFAISADFPFLIINLDLSIPSDKASDFNSSVIDSSRLDAKKEALKVFLKKHLVDVDRISISPSINSVAREMQFMGVHFKMHRGRYPFTRFPSHEFVVVTKPK